MPLRHAVDALGDAVRAPARPSPSASSAAARRGVSTPSQSFDRLGAGDRLGEALADGDRARAGSPDESGSATWPSARSSRSTVPPPERRASGARGRAASWPIRSIPSRRSSSTAASSMRSAAVGRSASASACAPGGQMHVPGTAPAPGGAPAVSAMASRTAKPRTSEQADDAPGHLLLAAEQVRGAAQVEEQAVRARRVQTTGDQRRAARMARVRSEPRSPSGSAGRISSPGTCARAWRLPCRAAAPAPGRRGRRRRSRCDCRCGGK